jgi:hypothetical protein
MPSMYYNPPSPHSGTLHLINNLNMELYITFNPSIFVSYLSSLTQHIRTSVLIVTLKILLSNFRLCKCRNEALHLSSNHLVRQSDFLTDSDDKA